MRLPNWLRLKLLSWAERHMREHPLPGTSESHRLIELCKDEPEWADNILALVEEHQRNGLAIGTNGNIYLKRWYILPRNRRLNVYLHEFQRDDDDRALHDHPWWSIAINLEHGYREMVPIDPDNPGGPSICREVRVGSVVIRRPTDAHRVCLYRYSSSGMVLDQPKLRKSVSIFITGPKRREWGFWCRKGWKRWEDFLGIKRGDKPVGDYTPAGCDDV